LWFPDADKTLEKIGCLQEKDSLETSKTTQSLASSVLSPTLTTYATSNDELLGECELFEGLPSRWLSENSLWFPDADKTLEKIGCLQEKDSLETSKTTQSLASSVLSPTLTTCATLSDKSPICSLAENVDKISELSCKNSKKVKPSTQESTEQLPQKRGREISEGELSRECRNPQKKPCLQMVTVIQDKTEKKVKKKISKLQQQVTCKQWEKIQWRVQLVKREKEKKRNRCRNKVFNVKNTWKGKEEECREGEVIKQKEELQRIKEGRAKIIGLQNAIEELKAASASAQNDLSEKKDEEVVENVWRLITSISCLKEEFPSEELINNLLNTRESNESNESSSYLPIEDAGTISELDCKNLKRKRVLKTTSMSSKVHDRIEYAVTQKMLRLRPMTPEQWEEIEHELQFVREKQEKILKTCAQKVCRRRMFLKRKKKEGKHDNMKKYLSELEKEEEELQKWYENRARTMAVESVLQDARTEAKGKMEIEASASGQSNLSEYNKEIFRNIWSLALQKELYLEESINANCGNIQIVV